MRCSILRANVGQVRQAGGKDIKEAKRTGVVFADLTVAQIEVLRSQGCKVNGTRDVRVDVAPPAPIGAVPTYSPSQMIVAAGYDELRNLTDPPLYGSGMRLAIIDTGIRETHEQIMGRVIASKNYTSAPMRDGFDHGTGVCSVALAVVPMCNILNLKVLDDDGIGTEEEVVLAIDDCIDLQDTDPEISPTVINLSLGAPDDGDPDNVLRAVCRAAIEAGIWIVASAGNSGPAMRTVTNPACERYVFAVGSAKYEPFMVSEFSSRGPTVEGLTKPDGLLFGEDMVMASSESDTAVVAKSGTSFSAPFAAGMIVAYHEGMIRLGGVVEFTGEIPVGIDPGLVGLLPPDVLIDQYLPGICIKPEGVPAGKDNDYGNGLPFGPLMVEAIGIAPALEISALISGLMMVGMMGIAMKTMT